MWSEEKIFEYINKIDEKWHIKEKWNAFKAQGDKTGPATFAALMAVVVIILFLAFVNSRRLTSSPKSFGDIKVWTGKPADIGRPPNPRIDQMLVMEKDGVPFLTIHKNKAGKITGLYLLKSTTDEPFFSMRPSETPGQWGCATYREGYKTGDIFMDINLDGRFDFKMVTGENLNLISRSIFLDGDWFEVDRASIDRMKAVKDKTWFTFDPNLGSWKPEK